MKVVIIVQARMTSTRLPGKILLPVLGKPLLEYQIERLKRCNKADGIVIATTINASDDVLVEKAKQWGVGCYRGDEEDVLSRYCEAAADFEADAIVRITSDCPLIDPAVVDRVINAFIAHPKRYDYVSNILHRTYPRGMDTEVVSAATLLKVAQLTQEPRFREHVTAFIYQNPEMFQIHGVEFDRDESRHRWTVDTIEDFELIRRILEALYPTTPMFSLEEIIKLIAFHPDWVLVNEKVEQKKV